ncbi:hypothetical protein HGM15179_016640 [Zosterops borbonicus]|uniref:Estradiol 17-beta-dehydrogenase 2 n=1 Tax=Zosterops borbonicus TaxID=364589 RepID=A0A8K1G2J4_9PASS|nr:hypothetical protein HGM15179_016640 [Zosterops borbonicus]
MRAWLVPRDSALLRAVAPGTQKINRALGPARKRFTHFFLLATDLVLAMSLSCFFYAFVCVSVAFLTCCMIIFSFGAAERRVDVKGRAIVILVSNSSIGRMFARNLDKAGFGVSAAQWSAQEERTVTEECSSNKEVAQLHLTEDEYEKTVKTFIESHLSLKGNF